MDKELFKPLSGFRDQLGPTKSWVIGEIQKAFESYGYQALETPAIERQEILLGKLGDEGQKQLYLFEDNGDRPVGLRYDLTVPLARFVASNLGSLTLPFKRFEIGSSWRAERPQKGRYRQFTQADIDIIGAPEPSSELEMLSVAAAVCERLKIKPVFHLNDRRLVTLLLDELKVKVDLRSKLLTLLDKKDKLTSEQFEEQFRELGLTDVELQKVRGYFMSEDDVFEQVEKALGQSESLTTIKAMLAWAKRRGITAQFTPSMVRGLDYYTGTIFELKAPEYDGGTIAGGGRYDDLIANLTGERVPAIGLSFGVDRLTDLLAGQAPEETLFIVRLPETTNELSLWVRELRQRGKKVEVYLDETMELGKQIKYAAKRGYQEIIIPLEEAWKKGQVEVKNLEIGRQEAVKRSDFEHE